MKVTPSKFLRYALTTFLIITPLQIRAAEAEQTNRDIQTTQPQQLGKEDKTRHPPQPLALDQLDAVTAGQVGAEVGEGNGLGVAIEVDFFFQE